MKKAKIFVICFWVIFLALGTTAATLWAAEEFRTPTIKDLKDSKQGYDDPRPWYAEAFSYKKILPPGVYAKLSYDAEAMKKLWAEIVGFSAPDQVYKIAPEIKPGTYSYNNKENLPGLKALMTEYHYKRFKPGARPHAGNFTEIKVVPTRQYYYALPVGEATKKYLGQTKLDEKTGLIKEETYGAGYPFPRPEGKFKANEIYYNWMKRYWGWDSKYLVQDARGWTGFLREDVVGESDSWALKLNGRVMEPYGYFDKRAQAQGEHATFSFKFYGPRDMFGNIIVQTQYLDPDKFDQTMLYVNSLRRVRLMSSTDVQDSVGGGDGIYLDSDLCSQKLSLKVFPTKLELVAERELLFPNNHDGSAYISSPSKGLEYHNLEWERRPMYVIKMIQLDKNFVYGHRILYFDKETFFLRLVENYDQKGRLYRTYESIFTFIPDMGMPNYGDLLAQDHIDLHSSASHNIIMPTPWIGRDKVSLEYLFTKGK